MSGLREKKKIERKTRIFNAAIKLFGTIGFESTTMEKIAFEAELGVGTLYNYYSSKGDILLSVISDRSEGFVQSFEKALNEHPVDVRESITLYYDIYFQSFSIYSKVIWREFIAYALSKTPSLIEFIAEIDAVFIENLFKLLLCLREEGFIKKTVAIENAVNTLYSVLIFHIIKYISDENMSLDDLADSLNTQTEVVINGIK